MMNGNFQRRKEEEGINWIGFEYGYILDYPEVEDNKLAWIVCNL
jgi:hypothetical protein